MNILEIQIRCYNHITIVTSIVFRLLVNVTANEMTIKKGSNL